LLEGYLEVFGQSRFYVEFLAGDRVQESQVAGMQEKHFWAMEGPFGVAFVGFVVGMKVGKVEGTAAVRSVSYDRETVVG